MNIIKLTNIFYKAAQQGNFDSFSDHVVKVLHDFLLKNLQLWVGETNLDAIAARLAPSYEGMDQFKTIFIPTELALSVDESKMFEDFDSAIYFILNPAQRASGENAQGQSFEVPAGFVAAMAQEMQQNAVTTLYPKLANEIMPYQEVIESDMNQVGEGKLKVVKTIEDIPINIPQPTVPIA